MAKDIINTRTGVSAGIGALAGFIFGGPPGALIGGLAGGAVAFGTENPSKGVMTPKRKLIYARAMETVKEPEELMKLADAFASEGLTTEANMLRKRAGLRNLPQETRDKRRTVFRKAMAADDPKVILDVAKEFELVGAIDAGKALRDHAAAVTAAHAAGKSSKPMQGGSQQQFADKLAKAIIHFGPDSERAKAAARNLIGARGKSASDALIAEVIKVAAQTLQIEAPKAEKEPTEPIQIATEPGEIEQPVVGGAAPTLEPAVVEGGAPVVEAAAVAAPPPPPQPATAPALSAPATKEQAASAATGE